MKKYSYIPKIVFCFDEELNHYKMQEEIVKKTLEKILPTDLFSEELSGNEKEQFQDLLPLIALSPCQQAPGKMSFFFLGKTRTSSFKFFFEMISHWTVVGKRLNVVLISATDFHMPEISDESYTLCEMAVMVADEEELQQILTYFPIIEAEIKLGLESSYYARRILEVKGLASDAKIASIHEHIAHLAKRLPKAFSPDILAEMQHVLVMCREEFKSSRTSRHLSRIISIQYLFRKSLRNAIKEKPDQRHLCLKLFKAALHLSKNKKNALCILVGLNFLRDKEHIGKKHLLKVIQSHIPEARHVENSFFVDRRSMENIGTLYLEVERNDGLEFTSEEILLLRSSLPKDILENIEYMMHPIFMPSNEEEVMRNILSLSNEIRYLRDIPQVIITFDQQTHTHLIFTVTIVRLLHPKSTPPLKEVLKKGANQSLEYIYDRSKPVGTLRKKYTKEASVFKAKLPKERFLRSDHSIDLYKARHHLVTDLASIVGDFRDFNGGMLTKQNELLNAIKELLEGDEIKYNDILLENFFYSLMPVTMRTVLEPEALKTLFLMLLNAIDHGFFGDNCYKIRQDLDFIFILIKIDNLNQKEELHRTLRKFNLHSTELAHFAIKARQVPYEGYIYRCDEPQKQQQFLQAVQSAMQQRLLQKGIG